ncbi:hypothetical protein ABZ626_03560 [Streptomyces longispororuber]|uniref:hypothetical protein n=1 Tax=Streptomyces longispororuber TaxID=68230 RepID=UPI0033FB8A43
MTGSRGTLTGTHVTGHAPCWGDPDFAVADGRWKTTEDLVAICEPVLYICGHCPYRAACIRQVVPAKAGFTGVCGGRIWLNGVIIRALPQTAPDELPPPVIRKACGTTAGVRAHRRATEQMCPKCRALQSAMAAPSTDGQLELPTQP